ncbi:MAG TPA: hypothetical protein VM308_05195 [Sphingomicrobium sp.]|nr:hypothetical protein [Sphingomicrobium sp.]
MLIPTLLAAVAASAQADGPSAPPAAMQQLLQSCDAHKFETVVTTTQDGQPRSSKVRICGTQGQSDEAWIRTLKDAVAKTEANTQMAAEVRQQIVQALNLEILRLSAPGAMRAVTAAPPASPPLPLPPGRSPPTANSLARDYGSLPPLAALTPSNAGTPGPSLLRSAAELPRVTLRCALVGDEDRPQRCDTIEPGVRLLLRADQDYPSGIALRFLRKGDVRGETKLPALRAGQTMRVDLPKRVCAGVVRSRLEIQAADGSKPAGIIGGKLGEFDLRC